MYYEVLTPYKEKMMEKLCSDQDVVSLITGKQDIVLPDKSLIYTQIFPFQYVPDFSEDAKTFVCFDANLSYEDEHYKSAVIYIWIMTHESLIRTSHGLRTDLLAEKVSKVFFGNREFGFGKMLPKSNKFFTPVSKHQGRELILYTTDFGKV